MQSLTDAEKVVNLHENIAAFESCVEQIEDHFEGKDKFIIHKVQALLQHLEWCESGLIRKVDEKRLSILKRLGHSAQLKQITRSSLEYYQNSSTKSGPLTRRSINGIRAFKFMHAAKPTKMQTIPYYSQNLTAVLYPFREICTANECESIFRFLGMNLFHIHRPIESIIDEESQFLITSTFFQANNSQYPRGICVHPTTGVVYITFATMKVRAVCPPKRKEFNMQQKDLMVAVDNPFGIAVSHDGQRICITSPSLEKIMVFNNQLEVVDQIFSHELNQFRNPHCIAFDSFGHVYVVCSWMSLMKVKLDTHERIRYIEIPSVFGIMINDADEIFVSGMEFRYILVFNLDLELQRKIPVGEIGSNWSHLARGPNNTIAVSDYKNNSVIIYDQEGRKLKTLTIDCPTGCAFGMDGELFVGSYHRERVTIF
eukprot:TRINITY_DN7064_c0_g1_i1.p1 TRINITY_DN7064_c0_g1~~TRINITY_DN7064_c0_g1_i1.p1  ORF type:complete len:427 (+),score=70.92 TRINITY_DN7064_c0_g1_i1:116-1396(+)